MPRRQEIPISSLVVEVALACPAPKLRRVCFPVRAHFFFCAAAITGMPGHASLTAHSWSGRLQCSGGVGPQEFVFKSPEEEVVVVQAFVGEASESFDDTGTVLWPAAPLLCYFLLSDAGRRLVHGASVLELGAGVGIPGLIAGRCACPTSASLPARQSLC